MSGEDFLEREPKNLMLRFLRRAWYIALAMSAAPILVLIYAIENFRDGNRRP